MSPSRRRPGTVDPMMRWLPRILALVTLVGLLAMHGLDAAATAAHAADGAPLAHGHAPVDEVAPPGPDAIAGSSGQRHRPLHHAAVACVFVLVTAAVFGIRRRLVRAARRTLGVARAAATALVGSMDPVWHPRRPVWVRLCVIRH